MLDSTFAVEVSLECEEPEAFRRFGASDGKIARVTANMKGLVAVYSGGNKDKYNMFRDIQRYWFWAIPEGFADRLARSCPIKPGNVYEMAFLEWLAKYAKATVHISKRGVRYQLTDRETIDDVKEQLRRIQLIREVSGQA